MTEQQLTQMVSKIVKGEITKIVTPLINEIKTQKAQIQRLTEIVAKTGKPQQNVNYEQPTPYPNLPQQKTKTLIPQEGSFPANYDPQFENNPILNELVNKNYSQFLKSMNTSAENFRKNNNPQLLK